MDKREAIGIRDLCFELTTVGDLVRRGVLERPIDGNHGEIHPKSSDFVAEGVPFVMASDLKNGRVDYNNCAFITERQAESLRKGFAKNGDVLLTHKATIGETAIVAYDKHSYIMLTPQVTYYRIKDKAVLNNRYLKAYFDSGFFQQTLHLLAGSGSTRAYLGITEQHRLPIILPPPDKQNKIAAVLATLDDLLANNQRRIALLESVAEEIYREWFVRMRFPGHADSPLDKGLPNGWMSLPLSSLVREVKNPVKKSDLLNHTRYVGLEHISKKSVALTMFGAPASVDSNKLAFARGDILFSKIRPYLHKVALAHFDGISSTDSLVLRATKELYREFALLTVFSETFIDLANTASKGTKMPRADWNFLKRLRVSTPSDALLGAFIEVVRPMFNEIAALIETNEILSKQAKSLLPRLVSGKLRVDHLDIQYPPSMTALAA
jgi:type I restriction enzyme S subunit